ncbi:aldo/keto reductase [Bosea sp. (in: a-proteobacteria)]|uniref:aldo/keto reductase n=1 Tax=Bosea sp. (in: a-proteobacteria) TaxID=1871050 RepID=UPI002B45CFA7|nr:aldo/keto reductase [Bosea sp. (in: a-proteobacteria)]WRH56041.1 MAG: aldo/keto reductase [Bosea sp. (in: a-proteobacteria)]
MPPASALAPRPLGRSRLPVSTLGFGGAPLGDLYARLDEAQAVATVEAAIAGGVTLFDTSPLYGHGLSEHRIGAALRRVPRDGLALSTKVGRVAEPFAGRGDGSGYRGGLPHGMRFDYSYDGAMRSHEQSALRLGVDHIDIVLIHDVDVWTHGAALIEQRFAEAMNGAYRALEALRAAGAVKAIGVGVNEAEMCERFARAGDFDTMLLAGRYSLLEQPALASFMPLALEKGIGLMLGGVFNSGILATGPVPGARYNYNPAPPDILARVAAIEAVCTRHGVPLRRAALQFPLGHAAVASLVMGAVSPAEVADQIAELSQPVPAALWAELKADGLLAADVPVPQ